MLKRTTKVLLPLGIVALAVAVALAMVNSRQPLAKAEAAPLLPKVRTVAVALGEVTPSIVAHGNVTARHELELVSEVSGRVEWIAPSSSRASWWQPARSWCVSMPSATASRSPRPGRPWRAPR